MDNEGHSEIIETIYDAACDPDQWPRVVSALRQRLHSLSAALFIQTSDQSYGGGILEGISPEFVDLYEKRFSCENPWFETPGLMKPGVAVTDLTLEQLTKRRDAFTCTAYYQDWFKPQGIRHSLGGIIACTDIGTLTFSLNRPACEGYFTEHEIRDFKLLSRHLARAVEINSKLNLSQGGAPSVSEAALNLLRLGVVILNPKQQVEFINAYAKGLIQSGSFRLHGSQLSGMDAASSSMLEKAYRNAKKTGKVSALQLPRSNRKDLSISVIPMTNQRTLFELERTYLLVLISDPDDHMLSASEFLSQHWRLTPLEVDIVQLLITGNSLTDIAEKLELTKQTTRWYSKQIMHKMGVNSQAGILMAVMNDVNRMLFCK